VVQSRVTPFLTIACSSTADCHLVSLSLRIRFPRTLNRMSFLVIDSGIFAMDSIFNEVCILVTAAFALTVVPGLGKPERSLLSRRDQGTALLVFTKFNATA